MICNTSKQYLGMVVEVERVEWRYNIIGIEKFKLAFKKVNGDIINIR
jgi:hypothetical protein